MRVLVQLLFMIGLFFTSCEKKTDEPTEVIIVDNNPDDTNEPIDTLSDDIFPRNILIEKITGVKCPNCPSATNIINGLKNNAYGDKVIVIKYHHGGLSGPFDLTSQDFRTEEGSSIVTEVIQERAGQPLTAFNREFKNNNQWLSSSDPIINEIADDTTSLKLFVMSDYDAAEGNVEVKVEYFNHLPLASSDGWRIHVILTEDNVVDRQSGGSNPYTHTEIFRDALTGAFGNPLSADYLANTKYTFDFEGTIASQWEANNLNVVVFVTDAQGKVIQVVQKSL